MTDQHALVRLNSPGKQCGRNGYTAACAEVTAVIHAIETRDEALKHCIEINRFENESDRLCRTLIAQLFDEETDPVQIIKWKEIFEVIETAVDKCEDVANVVEGVVLKSA